MANLGKRGNLGPVCKIHARDRWQRLTLHPKIIRYRKSTGKFRAKDFNKKKVREGPFWAFTKGDDVIMGR